MKAQELRIGNWINDITGHETQVRGTTKQGIWIGDNAGQGPEVAFTPIELTTEWLERFGFKQSTGWGGNKFYCLHTGFIEFQWEKSEEGILISIEDQVLTLDKIKYVHQLQNLYFCLTCQELELK